MQNKEIDSTQFLDDLQGKNLNFLIGAGASAGLVRTLDIPLLDMSFEDLYTSTTLVKRQRKVLDFIWFQLWIKDTLINRDKIKALKRSQSTESKLALNVIRNYIKFVTNLANFLDSEGYDKPKRANIFTTNYDSSFELAFDFVSLRNKLVYFNDGSRGFFDRYVSTENFNLNVSHSAVTDNFRRSIPTINLLKVHGSITWDKSGEDNIKVSMNPEIFSEVSKIAKNLFNELDKKGIIYKVFFDQSIEEYKTKKNLEVKLCDELSDFYETHQKNIEEFISKYHELQVVNPTKEKFRETVFQQNYYQMLRMLSFELEKRDAILVVFGFSFADEHIREIIKRSLINPYLKVYIICFDKKSKEKIQLLLEDIQSNNIEYLPHSFNEEKFGNITDIYGDYNYLNYLFGENENE